jgi:hypothetical protein
MSVNDCNKVGIYLIEQGFNRLTITSSHFEYLLVKLSPV